MTADGRYVELNALHNRCHRIFRIDGEQERHRFLVGDHPLSTIDVRLGFHAVKKCTTGGLHKKPVEIHMVELCQSERYSTVHSRKWYSTVENVHYINI